MIGIESLLTSLALLVAFTCPQLGSRWFATAERTLGALGRRRRTSIWCRTCRCAGADWTPFPPGYHLSAGWLGMS